MEMHERIYILIDLKKTFNTTVSKHIFTDVFFTPCLVPLRCPPTSPWKKRRRSCSLCRSPWLQTPNALTAARPLPRGPLPCTAVTGPADFWCADWRAVFICLQCSGVHRSLGVHLSFVRSITMDR